MKVEGKSIFKKYINIKRKGRENERDRKTERQRQYKKWSGHLLEQVNKAIIKLRFQGKGCDQHSRREPPVSDMGKEGIAMYTSKCSSKEFVKVERDILSDLFIVGFCLFFS